MDHEYAHVWQFKRGKYDGVTSQYDPRALKNEIDAHNWQKSTPNWGQTMKPFQDGNNAAIKMYENALFLACKSEACDDL